ncbi:hypothetical protein [Labrys miyagiensis]|uniref:hypothetical protein n=1 Tax=Labrys miyagiensis TaxID=346912 RepID=UPI0024E0F215|nr:hypothetical protein [Labrys miyagiensis]
MKVSDMPVSLRRVLSNVIFWISAFLIFITAYLDTRTGLGMSSAIVGVSPSAFFPNQFQSDLRIMGYEFMLVGVIYFVLSILLAWL